MSNILLAGILVFVMLIWIEQSGARAWWNARVFKAKQRGKLQWGNYKAKRRK